MTNPKNKYSKKHKITHSRKVFEDAFYKRVGQTPQDFICGKLKAGSTLDDTHYLYDITATAIAQSNYCTEYAFHCYYPPKSTKEIAENPVLKKYYCKNGDTVNVSFVDEDTIIVYYKDKKYKRKKSIIGVSLFESPVKNSD